MAKNNKINLKKSFSMVELMVSLSILIIVGLMVVVTATKKTEKAVTELTGAEYVCYKDNSGNLHQVATAYYFGGKSTKSSDEIVNSCKFTLPNNATQANVYLIGGGGGGGGILDITDDSIIMGTNTTWQSKNIWQDVTTSTETLLQPVDCHNDSESRYYYYDSNAGGYADCCTTDLLGNNAQCGIVTGIGSTLSGSNCPNIDINIRTTLNTAPSSKTITNMLSSYMTNEAYNNLLLKNYVISVKGGGASSYYNYATNLSINDDILCYNGAALIEGSNSGIGTTHISPTPGIIQINGKIVKKVKGTSWALSSNPGANAYRNSTGGQNYGAIEANTNPQPYKLYYKTVTLVPIGRSGRVKLPYGKNGEKGETTEIKGLNLAGKKIVINEDSVGNGGTGGQKSTNADKIKGGTGGTTTYTVNGTTRLAKGGAGGEVDFHGGSLGSYYTNPNKLNTGNSSDDVTWWKFDREPSKEITHYDNTGDVSLYISNLLNSGTSGVIDTNTFKAQPQSCNKTTKNCLTGVAPIAESYGAGGMGVNSLLLFGVNYKFALVKRDINNNVADKNHVLIGTFNGVNSYTPLIYKPELLPTFKGNDIPNNNGNGGAIIIKWGEALN